MFPRRSWAFVSGCLALGALVAWQTKNLVQVGDRRDGQVRVATGEDVPIDEASLALKGRPVDLVISADGNTAYVKHNRGISVVDLATRKVKSDVSVSSGASWVGLALSPDEKTLAYSDAHAQVWLYPVTPDGLGKPRSLKFLAGTVGGDAFPCGITYLPDGTMAVCLNRANQVALVEPVTDKVRLIPVDVAPYSVVTRGGSLYVTCWSASAKTKRKAESSGTSVDVDERGIGVAGSVVCLDIATGKRTWTASVALQPTEMAWTKDGLAVACSNGDRVTVLNPVDGHELRTLKAAERVRGEAPQSLAVGGDGTLYVACGGSNKVVAETSTGRFERSVGWYPGAVRVAKDQLIVACTKGQGERAVASHPGHSVYDFDGRLSIFPLAITSPSREQRLSQSPRKGQNAVPVPERDGEPSLIKHVVYVIKENRTYDQVFGDMKQGDGDASLAVFGRKVTPNHHRLAEQFILLDNFYCNGVNSADGHAWATEANSTTLFERSQGGWTRSYPFGDDPLATSATGYLWDNMLAHGKSFRNYGEFDYASVVPAGSYADLLTDLEKRGSKYKFTHNIGVRRVKDHSADYPGWNMGIPDVVRADLFIQDLGRRGLADFTVLYLPQDHTSGQAAGAPSPRAHVADNDLALGRVIEALSHHKDWATTCVFVVEDDSQDGFDHIDGHRSPCLVLSPFTRRGIVWSGFSNQTGVIHTMERILGVPPMTRFDAASPVLIDLFAKPDLTPYVAVRNETDLRETNGKGKTAMMRFDRPDSTNEEGLNRQIWASVNPDVPYPKAPNGVELARRGLRASAVKVDD